MDILTHFEITEQLNHLYANLPDTDVRILKSIIARDSFELKRGDSIKGICLENGVAPLYYYKLFDKCKSLLKSFT